MDFRNNVDIRTQKKLDTGVNVARSFTQQVLYFWISYSVFRPKKHEPISRAIDGPISRANSISQVYYFYCMSSYVHASLIYPHIIIHIYICVCIIYNYIYADNLCLMG